MKLNSTQVDRTLSQFEAQAVPDDHPLVPRLNDLFGEHTFFLDKKGLNILEPTDAPRAGAEAAKIVNLADWSDEKRTSLTPHEPESTDIVIALGTPL